MRKGFVLPIVAAALVAGTTIGFAQGHISIVVNGRPIQSDVPPQNVNGRVMVPIRFVAEALGASVGYDPATRTVTVSTAPAAQGTALTYLPTFTFSDVTLAQVNGVWRVRGRIRNNSTDLRKAVRVAVRVYRDEDGYARYTSPAVDVTPLDLAGGQTGTFDIELPTYTVQESKRFDLVWYFFS